MMCIYMFFGKINFANKEKFMKLILQSIYINLFYSLFKVL